jgi:hypothetical protein
MANEKSCCSSRLSLDGLWRSSSGDCIRPTNIGDEPSILLDGPRDRGGSALLAHFRRGHLEGASCGGCCAADAPTRKIHRAADLIGWLLRALQG